MSRGRKFPQGRKRISPPAIPVKQSLSDPEVHAILRAADEIIGQGGRTLLGKILKGSKDKKLLELGLDDNPAYGFYRELTLEQITGKVDDAIRADLLDTELSGKLPMLVFTPRGWVIERERRAEEFLQEWKGWLDNKITPSSMEYLQERNRGLIFLFLFKVLGSGDTKYIPYLQLWEKIAYRKVQAEIRQVIKDLNKYEQMEADEWLKLLKARSQTLIIRSNDPILLDCSCGRAFVFNEFDLSCYRVEGIHFQEKCPNCAYQKE